MMKNYIGTKQVKADPCSLGDFIQLSGRNPYTNDEEIHSNDEEGYLVEYEDGYKFWSSKEVFEKAYKCSETFLDRLHIERDDLADKLEKLCAFVRSPKFEETVKDEQQRNLLLEQSNYMAEYLNVLNQRINLLEQ